MVFVKSILMLYISSTLFSLIVIVIAQIRLNIRILRYLFTLVDYSSLISGSMIFAIYLSRVEKLWISSPRDSCSYRGIYLSCS